MRRLTLLTLGILLLFITYSLISPILFCIQTPTSSSSIPAIGNESPEPIVSSQNSTTFNVVFFSTIQQEGIMKILHEGKIYGKIQNVFNDYYYKFLYERILFWLRRVQDRDSEPDVKRGWWDDWIALRGFLDEQVNALLERFGWTPEEELEEEENQDNTTRNSNSAAHEEDSSLHVLPTPGDRKTQAERRKREKELLKKRASKRQPVHMFFLGDQFSSEHLFDDQFRDQLHRFEKHVFLRHSDVKQHFVAGNSDVGYGYSLTRYRLDRFETAFGKQNDVQEIGGVDFVYPLAVALDGSSPALTKATWNFVQEMAEKRRKNPHKPMVLVSHFPLFKENGKHSCQYNFRIRKSDDGMAQMQTQLSALTSKKLLSMLRPNLVISGHDHAGCTVTHKWTDEDGVEHLTEEHVQRSMQGDWSGHVGILRFKAPQQQKGNALEDAEFAPLESSYVSCPYVSTQMVVVFLVILLAEIILVSVLLSFTLVKLTWKLVKGTFLLVWNAFKARRHAKDE